MAPPQLHHHLLTHKTQKETLNHLIKGISPGWGQGFGAFHIQGHRQAPLSLFGVFPHHEGIGAGALLPMDGPEGVSRLIVPDLADFLGAASRQSHLGGVLSLQMGEEILRQGDVHGMGGGEYCRLGPELFPPSVGKEP